MDPLPEPVKVVPPGEAYTSKFLLTDEELQQIPGLRDCDYENYRRLKYTAAYGVSTWYDQLKDYTFRTEFLTLSYLEGDAISVRDDEKLTQEHKQALENLCKKIDQFLLEKFPQGAFIKLNTRSPKDAPIYNTLDQNLRKMVDEEIRSKPGHEHEPGHQAWSFIRATTRALKVTCGKDAMTLLRDSHRISEDLNKILQFPQNLFEANLVFREWNDDVPVRPDFEFRGFANKGKLNALSVYFHSIYSEKLHKEKDRTLALILKTFDEIKDKIPHEAYVIDFFVDSKDKVWVVELNPFHIGAGAGLFSWKTDREKFLHGPFEFRIHESLQEDEGKIIPLIWEKIFRKDYPGPPEPEESEEEANEFSWPIIAVGALLGVAATGGAYYFWSRSGEPKPEL